VVSVLAALPPEKEGPTDSADSDVVSVLAALPPEKEGPTDSTDSDVVSVLAALPPDVWKGCAFPGASALCFAVSARSCGRSPIEEKSGVAESRRLSAHRAAEPQ
jgi:hypothetical protein